MAIAFTKTMNRCLALLLLAYDSRLGIHIALADLWQGRAGCVCLSLCVVVVVVVVGRGEGEKVGTGIWILSARVIHQVFPFFFQP